MDNLSKCTQKKINSHNVLTCIDCGIALDHSNYTRGGEFADLFHRTCLVCDGVCQYCGYGLGSPKLDIQSKNFCSFCLKDCCKNCGIVVECLVCDQSVCSKCYNDEKYSLCTHLREKMDSLIRDYNN